MESTSSLGEVLSIAPGLPPTRPGQTEFEDDSSNPKLSAGRSLPSMTPPALASTTPGSRDAI
ncbi:hypothetical protein GCM10009758_24920 [Microbacterium hatanonis]